MAASAPPPSGASVADPHHLARVLSVQRALVVGRSTEAVTNVLLHGLRTVGADLALVALLTEDERDVLLVGGTDVPAPLAEHSRRVRLDDVSMVSEAVATGQRVMRAVGGETAPGSPQRRGSGRTDHVMVASPLHSHDRRVGAVVAYWTAPDSGLSAAELDEAEQLIAIAGERLGEVQLRESLSHTVDQLQQALDSRVVIEQAKGMIAQRHGIGTHGAFEQLQSYARDHNERLHGVAQRVVAGHLDPGELGREGEA